MSDGLGLAHLVQDYGLAISAIGAAVSGLYVLYKRILVPVFKSISKYNELCEKVDKIFYEITPNGGNSIKDTVNEMNIGLAIVNARQKALLADKREAIFEADSAGNCVWVNRTCSRLTQRMPSELLGHGWHNAIHEEDREYVVESWDHAIREQRELTLSFRFETPEGKLIPAKLRSYKMTDSDGEVIGYIGNIDVAKSSKL